MTDATLQARLGHQFRDPAFLTRALSHARLDSERLEFLGDRVLGLVVAEYLVATFPKAHEGELALRLNAVVRRESCAEIARALKLGDRLILARAEEASGGRDKPAILGDAMEAVIAALFLDGGIEVARQFILREFAGLLEGAADGPSRDAKTSLQEWAQGHRRGLPRYRLIGREGPDHAPHFSVEVAIDGLDPAQGTGSSRRAAEQAAAEAMLKTHGVIA